MKTSFAAAAALLFAAAIAAPAASAQQVTGAFQCIATAMVPGSSHASIYVSGMVPGDQSQRVAMNNAWSAYVRGAYPQQNFSTTICNPGTTDPANQQRVLAAEQSAWQRAGMQVVFVNWQPGQQPGNNAPKAHTNPYDDVAPPGDKGGAAAAGDKSKDAPAADDKDAAPPADAGPPPRASYCYSNDKLPTVYFSDAFDTAELPNPKAWSAAFNKMLADKYAYKGIVICKDGDTIFNVQGTIRDQKDALTGKQTVDTEWTYEPRAPGEPVPADAAPAPAKSAPAKKPATHKPN
jgi:hypothetical protein